MNNTKLYIVVEDFYYLEPGGKKDTCTHIITHNYDKALKVYNELVANEKELFKQLSDKFEVSEDNESILFNCADTGEYHEITLEKYYLKDDSYHFFH